VLALTIKILLSLPYKTDILHFIYTFLELLIVSKNNYNVVTLAIKTSFIKKGFTNSTLKDFVNK